MLQPQFNTKSKNLAPVYNAQGRVCGTIRAGVLEKKAKTKHMLTRPPAWAWDLSILEAAERAGCTHTRIIDQDTGLEYFASLAAFRVHGLKLNRGFGVQIALPLSFWTVTRPGEPEQLRLIA